MPIVHIRDQKVHVEEGDLLVTRSAACVGVLIALGNRGASHVTTLVRVGGTLSQVGVLPRPWIDQTGIEHPGGITIEPVELVGDSSYRKLWVCSPYKPRLEAQNAAIRLAVAAIVDADDRTGTSYDSGWEFLHSALGMFPATTHRYHCAELAAELAVAGGVWSRRRTTSVSIHELVDRIGTKREIF